MLAWAVGYVQGAAVWGVGSSVLSDGNAIAYWLDNYCRAHPSVFFAESVDAYSSHIEGSRQGTDVRLVKVKTASSELRFSVEPLDKGFVSR